jgi:hypothetical protein
MKITLIAEYVVNGKSEMKYESCWKEISPGDQTANANCMNDFKFYYMSKSEVSYIFFSL